MPLVSITKAAKLADLSRPYFHEAYIRTGKISVDRSDPKKPKVDTSDLIRIFGKIKPLQDDSHVEDTQDDTKHTGEDITLKLELERLKAENEGLKRLSDERLARLHEKDGLLTEKNQEISHYRERIHGLEARYDRLLEDKRPVKEEAAPMPTGFWKRVKSVFAP
jgi:DNA repair exonuclease SbcCD ATPase subunit